MDPQLTVLLQIQDLSTKLREMEAELGELEREHFGIEPEEACEVIRGKIAELEETLDRPVRRRYERIVGVVDRFVVPVIDGTCFGCFVSIPTARAGELDPNARLQSCEECGRFIYIVK